MSPCLQELPTGLFFKKPTHLRHNFIWSPPVREWHVISTRPTGRDWRCFSPHSVVLRARSGARRSRS